jgi:hypothetical protein
MVYGNGPHVRWRLKSQSRSRHLKPYDSSQIVDLQALQYLISSLPLVSSKCRSRHLKPYDSQVDSQVDLQALQYLISSSSPIILSNIELKKVIVAFVCYGRHYHTSAFGVQAKASLRIVTVLTKVGEAAEVLVPVDIIATGIAFNIIIILDAF